MSVFDSLDNALFEVVLCVVLLSGLGHSIVSYPKRRKSVAEIGDNLERKIENTINISEKLFVVLRNLLDVSYEFTRFEITDATEIEFVEGFLTIEERDWLNQNGVLRITGFHTETGEVSTMEVDVKKLAQIAYEFDILKSVASSVETEILDAFRENEETTLTTAEIAEETERPKSSVSRALTRLSEKDKLTKVQPGVYRKQ